MATHNNFATFPIIVLYLAAIVFYVYCYWRIYEKANKPGWANLIPIYNTIVMLEIIGRPWWWLLLLFVPVVNFVIGLLMMFELAQVFGEGVGFGFGLLFLPVIFIPILALGNDTYQGPLVHE